MKSVSVSSSKVNKKRKLSEDQELIIPLTQEPIIEVIASGFPESTTSDKVEKLFRKCGKFSIKCSNESRGVFTLVFNSEKSARKALVLNGGNYKGKPLLINTIESLPAIKQERQVPTSVFVGNVPATTTTEQLTSFFSGAGKIKGIRINAEKGFAHIDFSNRYAAQVAERLAGGKLNGQRLKIDIADKKSST